MKNLADVIENFIIGELFRDRENSLLVQRNELAEKLSCAPSQISYVLSTRFTPERGFRVESRRGSGGFVKIVRIAAKRLHTQEATAREAVEQMAAQRLITARERVLLHYFLEILDINEKQKKQVLKTALERLTAQ